MAGFTTDGKTDCVFLLTQDVLGWLDRAISEWQLERIQHLATLQLQMDIIRQMGENKEILQMCQIALERQEGCQLQVVVPVGMFLGWR